MAMELPIQTPAYVGTPISGSVSAVSGDNYQQLAAVAEWGRGSINAIAYSPNGSEFIVGSSFGMAVYSTDYPTNPPRWIAFDPQILYNDLIISTDGQFIKLIYNRGDKEISQIRNYTDGTIVKPAPNDIQWQRSSSLIHYQSIDVLSIDGKLRFSTVTKHDENNWTAVTINRDIIDAETNQKVSSLSDETMYVYYEDRSSPEGCDISSFSYCGNVYDPAPMEPYRVGFSSTDRTLAILYRAMDTYYSPHFSTLRLYNVDDGTFLTKLGSFSQPVQTFAFSPDGNTLLLGYVNGSIQLWDITQNKEIFSAWHFNAPIDYMVFSYDSRFLLLQRMGMLEVRSTVDGSLNGRYASSVFATSPVADLVAIANDDGVISINDIRSGKGLLTFQAHKGHIYSLAFSPDGKTLVSSGEDCDIKAWDTETGTALHSFEETTVKPYEDFHDSRIFIYYTRFIPGTDTLIGFGSWGTSVAWNVNSGATQYLVKSAPLEYYQGLQTLNPHFPESFGVNLAEDVFYIDTNAYNLQTGAFIGPSQLPADVPYGCSLAGPITTDGKLVYTVGIDNLEGRICVLSTKDYSYLGSIQVITNPESSSVYTDWIYLSPDGKQLIVTTTSGVVIVYQIVKQ